MSPTVDLLVISNEVRRPGIPSLQCHSVGKSGVEHGSHLVAPVGTAALLLSIPDLDSV